ncbi:hypothetical protein ACFDR9_000691 [Janthinobacterium sp. CG_23.3]
MAATKLSLNVEPMLQQICHFGAIGGDAALGGRSRIARSDAKA